MHSFIHGILKSILSAQELLLGLPPQYLFNLLDNEEKKIKNLHYSKL